MITHFPNIKGLFFIPLNIIGGHQIILNKGHQILPKKVRTNIVLSKEEKKD